MTKEVIPVSIKDHLEKVHSFAVIARVGSFRKAATVLRRTQPSLSRSVQVLEEAVGFSLLERTRLGVVPTPAGQALLDLNSRISDEVSRTEHRLRSRSSGVCAKLFVGSYSSLAIRIWPTLVRELSESHPGISIALKTDCEADRMLEMVRTSKLDLALTIPPSPYPDLVSKKIYSDDFGLYCSVKMMKKVFSASKYVSLEAIKQVPFVLVPTATHADRQTLERLATQLGLISNQMVYELDSFEAAKEFIREGVGVGLLPHWVAREARESGKLEELKVKELAGESIGQHTFYASFRRSDATSASILALVQAAQRLAKPR